MNEKLLDQIKYLFLFSLFSLSYKIEYVVDWSLLDQHRREVIVRGFSFVLITIANEKLLQVGTNNRHIYK